VNYFSTTLAVFYPVLYILLLLLLLLISFSFLYSSRPVLDGRYTGKGNAIH